MVQTQIGLNIIWMSLFSILFPFLVVVTFTSPCVYQVYPVQDLRHRCRSFELGANITRRAWTTFCEQLVLTNISQGLALAAKAAGNKEEALNNMKYIKVTSLWKSKCQPGK